jgi:HlyD family secretion protein
MDTVISQPQRNKYKIAVGLLTFLLLTAVISLQTDGTISTVYKDELDIVKISSTIPKITAVGVIKPRKSIKLSSDIGGRVKSYLNAENSFVKKNDILLELENYDYILKLTEKIAHISEQISNLKNMRLNLRRELMSSKLSLEDASFNFNVLNRELKQKLELLTQHLIQEAEIKDIEDNLSRWNSKKKVLHDYYESQNLQLSSQLKEISETISLLNELLHKLQESERQLVIKAPISGNLSGFDIDYGQQIHPKEEFASIDVIDDFVVEVELSEFYLDRVSESLEAVGKLDNRNIGLTTLKVFPLVKNGKFKIHFKVSNGEALKKNVKVGQSIEIEIKENTTELLPTIPIDSTFRENNANFIYLLANDQSKAVKTLISIKSQHGKRILIDEPRMIGRQLIVLDWNKKYKEELYIE